jgi:hypothetical protein
MRSVIRKALAVGVVAAGCLGSTGAAVAVGTPPVTAQAQVAFQQVSQCLQTHDDMAVLLVVDESGSLAETDPDNKRSGLLSNIVQTLGDQAGSPTATGTRVIDVAVSTFASGYSELVPWTELDSSSTAQVTATIES